MGHFKSHTAGFMHPIEDNGAERMRAPPRQGAMPAGWQ